jgi:hypothetical protein
MAKYKYLEVREKPFNQGKWVANLNVTHLTKKEIDFQWKELENTFPVDKYASCLTTTKDERAVFMDAPPQPNWSEVLEDWGGWESAPGYLTSKAFAEYIDKNYEMPKKKK